MGVLGLWQLLAPVGQPVALESLENKVFAVDISIWLNQALKGYRDSDGGSVPNAHLLSLFGRLCKLLFYKIRPIIVFDGGFPELKKQTIINRQQRRAAAKQSTREVGLKILSNYLASQKLGQLSNKESTGKVKFSSKEKSRDEIFKLPPLPENSQDGGYETSENVDEVERKFSFFSREDIKYLNKIDIDSDDFNNLPPDVKQELLSTLKESRKHRTWDQYEELPEESNEFSNYQMKCLLKRRKLQSKLEEVQKDIRKINSADFVAQYTNDHVIGETNKIMSDDCSYYVLLKKMIDNYEKPSVKLTECEKCSSSAMIDSKNAFIKDIENIDIYESSSLLDQNIKVEIDDVNVKAENNLLCESRSMLEEGDIDDPPISASVQNAQPHLKEQVSNDIKSQSSLNSKSEVIPPKTSISVSYVNSDDVLNPKDKTEHPDKGVTQISPVQKYNVAVLNTSISDNSDVELEIISPKDCAENASINNTVILSSTDDEMVSCDEMSTHDVDILYSSNENSITQSKNIDNLSCVSASLKVNAGNETAIVHKTSQNNVKDSNNQNTSTSEGVHLQKNINDASSNSVLNFFSDEKLNDSQSLDMNKSSTSVQAIKTDLPSTSVAHVLPDINNVNAQVISETIEVQKNLETAAAVLEAEQAKQDRQSNTVQEHMIEECKELLRLFGVPYIVSPLEAEAQCAFYDSIDLTHGTITDDSDVWLFGGKRVYKNFFTQQKYVEFYKDKEIFSHFGLTRRKLINFALLTGSDYTEGIESVGPVTAMEIISEFPGDGIDALQKFKEWWVKSNKHANPPENKIRGKLQKLILAENFPDDNIFEAYLNPEIDSSTEKFTWGRPDLDALRDYTRERFGWNKSKLDDSLLPVIKKLSDRDTQTHLDSFFTINLKKHTNLFPSKRIMSALKKITSKNQSFEDDTEVKTSQNKKKSRIASKKAVLANKKRKASTSKKGKRTAQPPAPMLSEDSSDEQ